MLAKELQELPSEAIAICPLDGRYSGIRDALAPYFSEYALVKNRVWVEVHWLVYLLETVYTNEILNSIPEDVIPDILDISESFSAESFAAVKEHEARINHDVKAVELFVDDELRAMGLDELTSFVHIGCTSEDITNIAYANMIKYALHDVWVPAAEELLDELEGFCHLDIPMLAHTHGQPATPTTVGKEFTVYYYRLSRSLENVMAIRPLAKFNGATGNYAAISVAFPEQELEWMELAEEFVEGELELDFNPVTTQIESHDYMCHLFDAMSHFDNVTLDLVRDMWLYISHGYFAQKAVKGEVGSSTMPHKVNPIRFENAEANIGCANAILNWLSSKLPVSRMQRDLSDSSAQRNIGMAFGYSLQTIQQAISGLKRVTVNHYVISQDLEDNWQVLAEPIQTVLRSYGHPEAYDMLKEYTRGKEISKEDIQNFIESCDALPPEAKAALIELTPKTYIGYADTIDEEVEAITESRKKALKDFERRYSH